MATSPEPTRPHAAGPSPEEDLARRARAGDRDAFAALHSRYASMVHGILIASAPPREAHDLAQEVFLSALESIASLDRAERFGPWLATIARNR